MKVLFDQEPYIASDAREFYPNSVKIGEFQLRLFQTPGEKYGFGYQIQSPGYNVTAGGYSSEADAKSAAHGKINEITDMQLRYGKK